MSDSKNQAKKNDELLAAAATQLAVETQRADNAETQLTAEKSRADAAEGQVATLTAQLKAAQEARIDAAEVEKRDATILSLQNKLAQEKSRADKAEAPERLRAAVSARVKLETAAGAVLGADTKMDGFSDRELMDVVIEKLLGVKTEAERSDDYARACFDTAVSGYFGGRDALAELRIKSSVSQPATRADAKGARQKMIERNQSGAKPRNQ